MGSFSNTKYLTTIDSLVQANTSKLNNPYYMFSDKMPTKVVYWKQNKTKTTLDPASELHYAHVGSTSPIKFNQINNFCLYGIEKITVDLDLGDDGIEASPISGEAVILPNTIEPLPGDFFAIPYIKEDLLFKVDAINTDTLDNGNNIYKIDYHMELTNSRSEIEKQVVATYEFVAGNVGTEFTCFLSSSDYALVGELEEVLNQLVSFYDGAFYKSRVQTYIYKDNRGFNLYDPAMIEFMRRNDIMTPPGGSYVYIAHQTTLSRTFPFEYSKSFFYYLEKKNKDKFASGNMVTVDLITEINSLFSARIEEYYKLSYIDECKSLKTKFTIFDADVISHIKSGEKYMNNDSKSVYNILISYMNNEENYISGYLIDKIHCIDCFDIKEMFYLIPIYIFIINQYIKSNILSSSTIQ